MKQMEWRETLDESAEDLSTLETLAAEVGQAHQNAVTLLEDECEKGHYQKAIEIVRGLLFIDKFAIELDDAIAELA
jgi:molecular chaperone HscB